MCVICEFFTNTTNTDEKTIELLKELFVGELHIEDCTELQEVPSLPVQLELKKLYIENCPNLEEIFCTETLTELQVEECTDLYKIHSMPNLEILFLYIPFH